MGDVLASVGSLVLLCPSLYIISQLSTELRNGLMSRVVIGFAAFLATVRLIPILAVYTERKGLFGRDLGKRLVPSLRDKHVPEALGLVSAIAFLVCVILSQCAYADSAQSQANYNSALTSVCFMVLLGFMDDVLDLPWRAKLILPTIASLPLLVTYSGSTSIVVPVPLRKFFVTLATTGATADSASGMSSGHLTAFGALVDHIPFVTVDTEAHGAILELGVFYLVYMGILAVFCTNAINIYAGINGLEAGQSYIIGCAMLFYCVLQVHLGSEDTEKYEFAATLILPFLGATLGLLRHNWFPSEVFVGDTFCYFAGMTFAVAGIHGHFTKPLWLFFLPQIANFLYSIPQLFKIVPCPRHRLPGVLEDSGGGNGRPSLMVPSRFEVKPGAHRLLKRLHGLPATATSLPNFTVINLVLGWLGPTSERGLCVVLLILQAASCAVALLFRFSPAASYLFDG